ncbi:MAG: type II secretion system protein J [Candidatus Dojkabacteria bacterium]
MRKPRTRKAFTLVEIILYVGLVSMLLVVVAGFLTSVLQSRERSETVSEVDSQGVKVMQDIIQTVRNAQAINSPTQGNSAATLSLDVVDGGADPTVYDLSGGALTITEGGGAVVDLTSGRVTASGLVFENLTRPGTDGIVRIEFTLTHVNPEGRFEYDYAQIFYGSANLKQN